MMNSLVKSILLSNISVCFQNVSAMDFRRVYEFPVAKKIPNNFPIHALPTDTFFCVNRKIRMKNQDNNLVQD